MTFRHQLAVFSPVGAGAVLRAAAQAVGAGRDPLPPLAALLRREYAAREVVLLGSGTQALTLAIARQLERAGDVAVALPAFVCYDVASAAVGAGARRLVLYDVDPETLAPDWASFERALAGGAGVAVVAPLYGVPVPWEVARDVAARRGALLVEDAAQGHGAAWRGAPLGALGEASILSFGRGKGWTGGGGGALLLRGELATSSHDGGDASRARELATTLGLAAQWALGRPSLYGLPRAVPALGLGETVYRPPVAPAPMTRAAAAAALRTAAAARAEAARRGATAAWLLERLPDARGVRAVAAPHEGVAGYLRLPVRLGAARALDDRLRRLGVERGYPTTLAVLPVVAARLAGGDARWPGAETLVRELVTLPTHSRLSPGDREAIVAALAAWAREG